LGKSQDPITAACVLLLCAAAFAAEPNFTASVDRTEITLGEQIQLTLRYDNLSAAGSPQLPQLDGFTVQYAGPQQQISIVNGERTDSVSHIFLLTPTREGTLNIPAFSLQVGGKVLASQPIAVKVGKAGQQGSGAEDYFALKLLPPRPEIFLNEIVPVDLKFYIRSGLRYRSQMPTISADGFTELKLQRPAESQETINGKSFIVYTFRALTSPLRTGTLSLGPAQTSVDVFVESQRRRRAFGFDDPFFDSFFGGGETKRVAVTSPPVKVLVRPLPDAGKPADFSGAIGRFVLDVSAKPTTLRAGEPVTLSVRVGGQGNLATVAPPKFVPPEGFKSYDPVVKSKQTDELGLTAEKVFEQVIVPLSARASVIPPITFSYFDPEQARYATLSKGPIQLNVQEAPGGAAPVVLGMAPPQTAPRPQEKLGAGIVYLKPDLGVVVGNAPALYRQAWFLAAQTVPALALFGAFLLKRHRDRLAGDIGYARSRRAYGIAQRRLGQAGAQMAKPPAFYAAIFKCLQDYLGDRLNLPSSGITSAIVEEQLRPRGVANDLCEGLKQLFADCDTARFAPQLQSGLDRQRTLKLARDIVAALEKTPL
jgi:hypothetical protein